MAFAMTATHDHDHHSLPLPHRLPAHAHPHPVGVDPALSGEPSEALERATSRAQQLGLTLRGMGGEAEELPFESGSFDAVVSTLVFCSVRDPVAALREVSFVVCARVDFGAHVEEY